MMANGIINLTQDYTSNAQARHLNNVEAQSKFNLPARLLNQCLINKTCCLLVHTGQVLPMLSYHSNAVNLNRYYKNTLI